MQQIMGTDVSEDQKMEHTIAALLYNLHQIKRRSNSALIKSN